MIRFACARLWQPTAQRAALHLIWYSVVVIIAAASQALPAQAQCLDQMRKLQLTDGAIRLKSYVCEVGGKSRKVRVELQRLSEVAAGSLVQNTPHPDVERALGRVRVVSNEILTEARELFTRFATKRVVQSCHSLELTAPGGASYSSRSDQSCNKRRTMWYFSFPDQENATTIDISLPQDLAYIQNQTRWPSGYKFWYSDCIGTAFIECTTIWRPASENMISDYNSNKERLEKKLGINSSRSLDPDDYSTRVEKYFSLVKHLMHEVWRDDFMHVTGTFDECGG